MQVSKGASLPRYKSARAQVYKNTSPHKSPKIQVWEDTTSQAKNVSYDLGPKTGQNGNATPRTWMWLPLSWCSNINTAKSWLRGVLREVAPFNSLPDLPAFRFKIAITAILFSFQPCVVCVTFERFFLEWFFNLMTISCNICPHKLQAYLTRVSHHLQKNKTAQLLSTTGQGQSGWVARPKKIRGHALYHDYITNSETNAYVQKNNFRSKVII